MAMQKFVHEFIFVGIVGWHVLVDESEVELLFLFVVDDRNGFAVADVGQHYFVLGFAVCFGLLFLHINNNDATYI